jgi:hypothetical protein
MTARGRGDFWARRKAAVAAEQTRAEAAETARFDAETQAALEARDDAEILAELDLPDPDALQPGDDIRGFLSKAVPERLRRRALRRLWRLNPVLANLDGLNDYDTDFTDSALPGGKLQTAYQVGKGMLAHVQHLEAMALKAEAGTPDAAEAPRDAPDPVVADDAGHPEPPPAEVHAALPHETQENQSDTRYDAPRHRPMRFEFDA